MRSLTLSVAMIVAIAACGPSNKEIASAKQARYQGDKTTLFNATKAAVEANHKLFKADEGHLGMQTVPKWYTAEGMISAGSDENMKEVGDRAIRLTLVVRMLPDGNDWLVQVEPAMVRHLSGSPQPQSLEPKDPSVPGWVHGQVDQLQFDIYNALKQYEVKGAGAAMPAGPAAPEAAPEAPASTDGSAAPAESAPAADTAPAPAP